MGGSERAALFACEAMAAGRWLQMRRHTSNSSREWFACLQFLLGSGSSIRSVRAHLPPMVHDVVGRDLGEVSG